MVDLTLPGTLPGLLEEGSRVVCETGAEGLVVCTCDDLVTVFHATAQRWLIDYTPDRVSLDLRHTSSRDRALRWWAGRKFGCEFRYPLDPNNPARLADGSRWVDAEALRLCCFEVDRW